EVRSGKRIHDGLQITISSRRGRHSKAASLFVWHAKLGLGTLATRALKNPRLQKLSPRSDHRIVTRLMTASGTRRMCLHVRCRAALGGLAEAASTLRGCGNLTWSSL